MASNCVTSEGFSVGTSIKSEMVPSQQRQIPVQGYGFDLAGNDCKATFPFDRKCSVKAAQTGRYGGNPSPGQRPSEA